MVAYVITTTGQYGNCANVAITNGAKINQLYFG